VIGGEEAGLAGAGELSPMQARIELLLALLAAP